MKAKLLVVIFIFFTSIFFVARANAESQYVLPYPGAMPGNVLYRINLLQEEILKYWYYGDFGQFHYNLKQSDKYLVEAKTLFDYRQYLLAIHALEKSDKYFKKILPSLFSAKEKGKNTAEKEKILIEAAVKHKEELIKLKASLPENFEWRPEKADPQKLNLKKILDKSMELRSL